MNCASKPGLVAIGTNLPPEAVRVLVFTGYAPATLPVSIGDHVRTLRSWVRNPDIGANAHRPAL